MITVITREEAIDLKTRFPLEVAMKHIQRKIRARAQDGYDSVCVKRLYCLLPEYEWLRDRVIQELEIVGFTCVIKPSNLEEALRGTKNRFWQKIIAFAHRSDDERARKLVVSWGEETKI